MMESIPLRVASMGPADSGKSTLFGYIVLNSIKEEDKKTYWEQVQKWKTRESWYRRDRVYTYIFDRLQIERAGHLYDDGKTEYQGTSRVPTHIECTIREKKYLLIDVPGHEKFISNATIGIFQAQFGVLVIGSDSLKPSDGFKSIIDILQTIKNHRNNQDILVKLLQKKLPKFWNILLYPVLVRTYGFRQLIVVISKMDLVEFDQTFFRLAIDEIQSFLTAYSGLKEENIFFIPTSIDVDAQSDINVTTPIPTTHAMNWYQKLPLVELLSQIQPSQPSKGSLLIPVEGVFWKQLPGNPLVLTGRILRGTISRGQNVQVSPLCDPSREFHDTDMLKGRVKSIRKRNQSAELPWIGKFSSDLTDQDDRFEAGHVVGINLHPHKKTKLKEEKFTRLFRKGCIITEDSDNIISGNVLQAKVFVPIYSRSIEKGHSWDVYLYGKRKGSSSILSVKRDEFPYEIPWKSDDNKIIGHFAEVTLLLDSPTDYPGNNGEIDVDIRDVVLRHSQSFCGGQIISLYFIERIRVTLEYEQENNVSRKTLEKLFRNVHNRKKLDIKSEGKAARKYCWKIEILNPTPGDIRLIYKTCKKRITPKPLFCEIKLIPEASS